jgi:16S rRNA (cytosine1402-N4)-methyltransferase
MTESDRHRPVMLEEVLEALAPRPGARMVDATLGEAGYAEAILDRTAPDGRLLAIDWDDEALALSRPRLAPYGDRVHIVHGSFADLAAILVDVGWADGADGIVVDLGVSTRHLVVAERGFSFRSDGPLDMRMDRRRQRSAADLLSELEEEDLADIIWRYGEERHSRRIARAIVRRRDERPLRTTGDLREVVGEAGVRGRPGHDPATRTFQALRIAVNGELEALEALLSEGWRLLAPRGRLVIVSYHSLEDRLVKNALRTWASTCLCPPRAPICNCGWTAKVSLPWRRKRKPTAEEIARNPRARSAGVRVAERLAA